MTSKDIETQSIGEILRYMNDENRKITDAIEQCIPSRKKLHSECFVNVERRPIIDLSGRGDFWSTVF